MNNDKFLREFKSARNVGTPLIGINCPDPFSTMALIQSHLYQDSDPNPTSILQWDINRGLIGRNTIAKAMLKAVDIAGEQLSNPVACLERLVDIREDSIVFLINGHFFLQPYYDGRAEYIQCILNLRDDFKSQLKTLVILSPYIVLPPEIQHDFYIIDEPLPTEQHLREIVTSTVSDADIESMVKEDDIENAVNALRGLSSFPAEQATAMSITRSGLNVGSVWERKRQLIDKTPGLSVWRGQDMFSELGGVENVKHFMTKVIAGREAPRVVVFIDEIEKMLAGHGQDSTGVTQDQLGVLLSEMENKKYGGSIFIGPPGAAKSAVAKAIGNEAGIPTIVFDLGGMKDSLVGNSEQRIREALKVVDSVGGGQALFIATCNKLTSMPPELRRRFTMGTFFFDLPTKEERSMIWRIYIDKFELEEGSSKTYDFFDDEGWTGAEIRQCCLLSHRLQISLKEASNYIVPVSKSAANEIRILRQDAAGKFLSASSPGIYGAEPEPLMVDAATSSKTGRKFTT